MDIDALARSLGVDPNSLPQTQPLPSPQQAAPPPAAAASPPPRTVRLDIEVPEGADVGDRLTFNTATGPFSLVVPSGAAPGQKLMVTMPVPANFASNQQLAISSLRINGNLPAPKHTPEQLAKVAADKAGADKAVSDNAAAAPAKAEAVAKAAYNRLAAEEAAAALAAALDRFDIRAAQRDLDRADDRGLADTDEVQAQRRRFEQLEAEEERARRAIEAAEEDMCVESMRAAVALAEALGGDEDPMRLGLQSAKRYLAKWESRDAAADALRRALDDEMAQVDVNVIARADAVHAARVRAREAGVAEVDNALLEQAERVEARLRMLQINEVNYEHIGPDGRRQQRPFAGGGGSEAAMYDASFQGVQVAAKVFSLAGAFSAQTDKMREVHREFAALKRAQEHHPPTNIALPYNGPPK